MKNNYWTIDGINEAFESLKDAKWHVEIAFTNNERVKWLTNTSISHIVNGEVVSTVKINIDSDGGFKFGRIEKF
jgi:hypothetical protein